MIDELSLMRRKNTGQVNLTKGKISVLLLVVAGAAIFTAFELKGTGPVQYYTAKVENGEI